MKGDERILGDGDFAEKVLDQAQEAYERKQALQAKSIDTNAEARRVADFLNIDVKLVWSPGKNRSIVYTRSLLCYWSVGESGLRLSQFARQLGLPVTAISQSWNAVNATPLRKIFRLIMQNFKMMRAPFIPHYPSIKIPADIA